MLRAQGHLGHSASPSLGHYATLSFVVIGKGMVQFGISDFGFGIGVRQNRPNWHKRQTGITFRVITPGLPLSNEYTIAIVCSDHLSRLSRDNNS